MEAERIKIARWIVAAPPGYANAELNGELVMLMATDGKIATTLILTGSESGRQWQFSHDHLVLKP